MDVRLLLNTGIENIDTVYDGVRGTTLSSRHNLRHWQTVVQNRTDMALSIYWMFHGADRNLQPPYLKGHFPMSDSGRKGVDPAKIFRRLNSLYEYLTENRLIDIPDKATFALRRKELIENQLIYCAKIMHK
jgi:hypothetical protein